jgi:hypothetical protein
MTVASQGGSQSASPETEPQIVHRVYMLDRTCAQELFGTEVAAAVPEDGLVDVHRYLAVVLNEQRVEIDATFPGAAWEGHSSLPLACGSGEDYPAGDDPGMEKRALEDQHCDPTVREPFIAALTHAGVGVARRNGLSAELVTSQRQLREHDHARACLPDQARVRSCV